MVVFGQSLRGVRWKMIINDEDLGDITAATDISFDLLLHLFLKNKILKSAVNSMVNWYTVSIKKLTEVAKSVTAMGLFNNGSNYM